MDQDTIVAISTAVNNSGISVIRLSGPESVSIVDNVYKSKTGNKKLKDQASHTVHYGYIIDDDSCGNVVDEVLILIMKSPNSYTMEDVVEVDCHGRTGGIF